MPLNLLVLAALIASPAAAQGPGQLLAADPVVNAPAGMQAWRVRYLTRDDRGAPRQVAGMVVAPREAMPARPRLVIAWTHGTSGIAAQFAPSMMPTFWTLTPALEAVRRG